MSPTFSLFLNKKEEQPTTSLGLETFIGLVKSPRWERQVTAIRCAPPELADQRKKALPAVTPSGTFSKRGAAGLLAHSGFVVIDIDEVGRDRAQVLRSQASSDKHCAGGFISPSGNGVKLFFRVAADATAHHASWEQVAQYVESAYNVPVDPSGKDVPRLCFVSHDPEAFYNKDAIPLPAVNGAQPIVVKPASVAPAALFDDLDLLKPPADDTTLEDVEDALNKLDPDAPYADWLSVAMALRHQFPSEPDTQVAFELFDQWSAKGEKYDAGEVLRVWNSITANPRGKAAVTIRSVIKKAKANGWTKSAARAKAAGKTDVMVPSGDVQIRDTAIELAKVFAPLEELFVRSNTVVEQVVGTDGPELVQIGPDEALTRFERRCRLLAWRVGKDGEKVLKPTKLPVADARAILVSRELWEGLPQIELVSNSPLITSTGAILGPGYHKEQGGVLVTGKHMPETVTTDDAVEALLGLLEDFRFATDGDGSRALASFLTPALRMGELISGHVPVDVAEADHSQSGKTYRQMVVRAVYNEVAYPITKKTGGVGSLDESLAAALFSGKPFIAFDNYRGKLDSPSLESALTWGKPIRVRVPYHGEVAVDIKRVSFQLTSNGFDATKDLANRVSIVRILKQPEGYQFKSYPEGDLLKHVEARQPFYLGCVFALIRAWLDAGKPRTDEARHDFREWAQTLDWIVQNVCCMSPLMDGHRSAQERVSDPFLTWLRQVAVAATSAPDLHSGELRALGIYELCAKAGIEITGAQNSDEALQRIGSMMEKLFRDKGDCLTVDQYCVRRATRNDPLNDYKKRHFYTFSLVATP